MLPLAHDANERVSWRCAVPIDVLVASASLLGLLRSPMTEHPLAMAGAVSVTWALLILAVLATQPKRPRLPVARAALPLFPTFWLLFGKRSLPDLPLEAFVRQEGVGIVYALATPPSPVLGLVVIATFAVDSLVLLGWLGPHAHWVAAQSWQPWTILLYGGCAAVLAVYRARAQRTEVTAIVEAERAAATQRLVTAHLAVRDLINTPLQALKVAVSLVTTRFPAARDLTDAMGRAVDRPHRPNHLLSTNESKISWGGGAESLDPVRVLEAARAETMP